MMINFPMQINERTHTSFALSTLHSKLEEKFLHSTKRIWQCSAAYRANEPPQANPQNVSPQLSNIFLLATLASAFPTISYHE